VKILQDDIDFNDVDEMFLSDIDLKNWLLSNNFHVLLAEFYFEYGQATEALNIWKDYITVCGFDQEKIEPLANRLLSVKVGDKQVEPSMEMIKWLTPKMPEFCMNIVKQISCEDFEWLSDTFTDYPNLLLHYLESQIEEFGQKVRSLYYYYSHTYN
jgi:hypothetical protein